MLKVLFWNIVLSVVCYFSANAAFLDLPTFQNHSRNDGIYLWPNEDDPARAKPILQIAEKGIYIAVGADRGFIGAALAPNITHLLLLDNDQAIVKFNRINIGLLQLPLTRQDYLAFRTSKMTYANWKDRVKRSTSLESDFLLKEGTWSWWQDNIANNHLFSQFHAAPGSGEQVAKWGEPAFVGANYIYDDDLFLKLKNMADAGRIQTHSVNLSSLNEVTSLEGAIRKAKLQISVLDMSNTWQNERLVPSWIPTATFVTIIRILESASSPRGILLLSRGHHPDGNSWDYYGIAITEFRDEKKGREFISAFHEPISWEIDAIDYWKVSLFHELNYWSVERGAPCFSLAN